MPDVVLRAEALSKRYGSRLALDGLDLEVRQGEIVGLLGPNGAGKTTALRLLLGLIRATSGRAWLLGEPVPAPRHLARVGAIVEEPAFYPWLGGRHNLEVILGAGPPLDSSAVEGALRRVDLDHVADQPVKTYSLGMRQRLALALALARQPSLLLLDEPTNGLDHPGIRQLREILRGLRANGAAVVFASHSLAEVEQICDRAAVLRRGRLVAFGDVATLGRGEQVVRVVVDRPDRKLAERLLAAFGPEPSGSDTLLLRGVGGQEVNRILAQGGIFAEAIVPENAGLEERVLGLLEEDGRAVGQG